MITCAACRSVDTGEAKFCRKCGAPMGNPVAQLQTTPPPLPARESSSTANRTPTALLVINILLFGLLQLTVVFVVPIFAAMFADFGAQLPGPTQLLLDFSSFCRRWWLGEAIFSAALTLAVIRSANHHYLETWLIVALFIQGVSLAFMVFSLFFPIFQLGAVAGGLP